MGGPKPFDPKVFAKYEDMLSLERPNSKHAKMPMEKRAAQFAPFKALEGQDEETHELMRHVEEYRGIEEQQSEELEWKSKTLLQNKEKDVTVTFFEPDTRKEGGVYRCLDTKLLSYDHRNEVFVFAGGLRVKKEHLVDLESELFLEIEE